MTLKDRNSVQNNDELKSILDEIAPENIFNGIKQNVNTKWTPQYLVQCVFLWTTCNPPTLTESIRLRVSFISRISNAIWKFHRDVRRLYLAIQQVPRRPQGTDPTTSARIDQDQIGKILSRRKVLPPRRRRKWKTNAANRGERQTIRSKIEQKEARQTKTERKEQ